MKIKEFFFHQVTQTTCGIVATLFFLLCLLRACLSERRKLNFSFVTPSSGHRDAGHTKHWWLIPIFSSFIWSCHVFESRPNTAVPLWAACELGRTACVGPDCCGKAFRGGPSESCVLVKQLPKRCARFIFLPSWHLNASKERAFRQRMNRCYILLQSSIVFIPAASEQTSNHTLVTHALKMPWVRH